MLDTVESEIRHGAQIRRAHGLLGLPEGGGAHGLAYPEGLVCILHATESALGLGDGVADVEASLVEYLRITCSVRSEEQDDDRESLQRNNES